MHLILRGQVVTSALASDAPCDDTGGLLSSTEVVC